ncbi:MAG: hypothetical protein GY854_28685 [Deltaproteobacteria bacterium]|nr:hypothetical protein [Deltaproteobacteria bacterium]
MTLTFVAALAGGFVSVLLALLVAHRYGFAAEIRQVRDDIKRITKTLEEIGIACGLSVSIVEPHDFKTFKRKGDSDLTISAKVKGIVTGEISSVYLVTRPAGRHEVRVCQKANLHDGYWTGSVRISKWDKGPNFEVLAYGFVAETDFTPFQRIRFPAEGAVQSAPIPLKVETEP